MNSSLKFKKVLVAPLDWGLGHATRCIPVIRELKQSGCEILIASEGKQAALLKKEFPEVLHLSLPGYRMSYSQSEKTFGLKMLAQLPKMQKAIQREHKWLKNIVSRYQPDGIISDNRFGLFHSRVPSVIMTHQLHIFSPFPGRPESWLQKVNYHYLEKFRACWVVDFEGKENLAGRLSHPEIVPSLPVEYLGALSRFEKKEDQVTKYDVLVLISGPEPQRTKFETLIRQQLLHLPLRALMVCGRPDEPGKEKLSPTIELVRHLDSEALNRALQQSRMVVARSGYTTIMDLVKLQKKAILVPTPGQSEQEYLAENLQGKGYFLSLPQQSFDLKEALLQAANFTFNKFPLQEMDDYKKIVRQFVAEL